MPEAFNSIFITIRSKPTVTIIEEIKVYLMLKWESNGQKTFKYEGNILSNIKRIVNDSQKINNLIMRHKRMVSLQRKKPTERESSPNFLTPVRLQKET